MAGLCNHVAVQLGLVEQAADGDHMARRTQPNDASLASTRSAWRACKHRRLPGRANQTAVASPMLWLLVDAVAALQHPVMQAWIGRETFDLFRADAASDGFVFDAL